MRSVENEEQETHRVADTPHQRIRQHADDPLKGSDDQVFDLTSHGRRSRSHARKSAAGSIDAFSGTSANGRSLSSSSPSRTASLAVVSTMAAAAFLASRSMRMRSARLKRW